MSKVRASSDSGEIVLDRLPVPKSGRDSAPRLPAAPPRDWAKQKRRALIGGAAVGVMLVGFLARPYVLPDGRISDADARAVAATTAAAAEAARASKLATSYAEATSENRRLAEKLRAADEFREEITDKAAAAAKRNEATLEVKAKLATAFEKSASVTLETDGLDVVIAIPDKALFKPGDDALTEKGTKLLARLGTVLKTDLPDRWIAVQGHTDDQPIAAFKPAPAPKPRRVALPTAPVVVRFRTNWELSAARALAVIHYFQDTARLDPSRLAALAFGQYRPASVTEKAKNRRLELVLSPRPATK